jgi:predicted nucleic acid-binding protein
MSCFPDPPTPRSTADLKEGIRQHMRKRYAREDANVVAAALEYFRAKPSMGFSDSLIVEIARKAGHLPLGTFDGALGKFDGAECL